MKSSIIVATVSFLALPLLASERTVQEVVREVMVHDLTKVMDRHKRETKASDAQARLHEREFKRYLALNILYPRGQFSMFNEAIDNVWHTFIIHTKDYMEFCQKNNGGYLHHEPAEGKQDAELNRKKAWDFAVKYAAVFKENPPKDIWPYESPESADYLKKSIDSIYCHSTCNCWSVQDDNVRTLGLSREVTPLAKALVW